MGKLLIPHQGMSQSGEEEGQEGRKVTRSGSGSTGNQSKQEVMGTGGGDAFIMKHEVIGYSWALARLG